VRTESLIVELAGQGTPVVPLRPVSERLAWWAAVTALATAAIVFGVGPRADLAAAMTRTPFLAAGLLTLSAAALGGWLALQSSVPGALRHSWTRWTPLALLAAWIVFIAGELVWSGTPLARLAGERWHAVCAAKVMATAVLPGIGLFMMMRRGAPLSAGWAATLAAVAASALGAFGAQVICPIDRVAHLALFHVVPVVSLAVVTAAFGTRVLRFRP